VGVTYQIGNMISSPSAQIVNAIAESHFVTSKSGERVEAYGPTMGIATVIIALGIAVTVMLGPEHKGSRFELAKPAGVQEEEIRHKLGSDAGMERGEAEKTVPQQLEVSPAEKTEKV
jgi:hypothetical protein